MLPLSIVFRLHVLSSGKSSVARGTWPMSYSYHKKVLRADLVDYHSLYTMLYERDGILVGRSRGEPITIGRLAGNEITSTFLDIGDTIHGILRPFSVLLFEDEISGKTVVLDGCVRLTQASRSGSKVQVTFLLVRGAFWPDHPDLRPLHDPHDFRDLLIS